MELQQLFYLVGTIVGFLFLLQLVAPKTERRVVDVIYPWRWRGFGPRWRRRRGRRWYW